MSELDRYGGWTGLTSSATGFFRLEKIDGRWWFVDPDGNAFIMLGVNHITHTALKYPDNIHIWKERYGGSMERWIREGVAKDLRDWGFNTIAWVQELASKDFRHSPEWHYWEYKWAGMPYIYHIDFAHIEYWYRYAVYPDVFSEEFEEWCDYLAREVCVDMAEEPLLIGYTFCPMPGWTHNEHVRCWADDLDLETEEGRNALKRIAERYYQVIHDSIRRYDRNHLLLGDSYRGASGIPDFILEAMMPTMDLVSTNWNSRFDPMKDSIDYWHEFTGKPILLADSGFLAPTEILKVGPAAANYVKDQRARGDAYIDFGTKAFSTPHVVGWGWCAYLENRARCSGVKNYMDEPYQDLVHAMREFNSRVYDVASQARRAR